MKYIYLPVAAVLLFWGCSLVGGPSDATPAKVVLGDTSDTEILTGEVRYFELEGGFWAIAGDTTNYDPINLPETFRRENLPVRARAVFREDLGSYHMVGPIVEIRSIEMR